MRGRPRDLRVDDVVLKVTLAELAQHGYQGMSIDGIAVRSGVSKPTIYRRWPNKPALAIAAIAALVAQEPPELTGNTLEDLIGQLQAAHENLVRLGSVTLLGTLLAESERHPKFIRTYREALLEPRRARLRSILESARARKEIAASDDQIDTATLLLIGLVYAKYMSGEPPRAGWLTPGVEMTVSALAIDRNSSMTPARRPSTRRSA